MAYGPGAATWERGRPWALGTLAAALLGGLFSALPLLSSLFPGTPRLPFTGGPFFVFWGLVGTLLAFWPIYVAVNWLEVIRETVRADGGTPE